MAKSNLNPGVSHPHRYNRRALSLYLKAHRQKAGFTQIELSERLGYSTAQFISNIERGICAVPMNVVALYAELCEINKDELLGMLMKDTEKEFRRALSMPGPKKGVS